MDPDLRRDDLGFFRGLVIAGLICTPFWVLLGVTVGPRVVELFR